MISLHFGFIFGFHSAHNTCEHTRKSMQQQYQKYMYKLKWLAATTLSLSHSRSHKRRPNSLHSSELRWQTMRHLEHYKVQILVLYLAINHHRSYQLFSAQLIHKCACYIQLRPLKNMQSMPFDHPAMDLILK